MTTTSLRLAAFTFLLAAGSLVAAIPPAENLLPADTLAFFAAPDCAAARAAAKQSPGWLFWGDPAMKPFHDHFMAKWNEQFVAPLERDLGLKVRDFTDLPQGQLTLAVTVNGSNGHDDVPPGMLLLLDTKGKSDSLKTNLAALGEKVDGRRPRAAHGKIPRPRLYRGAAVEQRFCRHLPEKDAGGRTRQGTAKTDSQARRNLFHAVSVAAHRGQFAESRRAGRRAPDRRQHARHRGQRGVRRRQSGAVPR